MLATTCSNLLRPDRQLAAATPSSSFVSVVRNNQNRSNFYLNRKNSITTPTIAAKRAAEKHSKKVAESATTHKYLQQHSQAGLTNKSKCRNMCRKNRLACNQDACKRGFPPWLLHKFAYVCVANHSRHFVAATVFANSAHTHNTLYIFNNLLATKRCNRLHSARSVPPSAVFAFVVWRICWCVCARVAYPVWALKP